MKRISLMFLATLFVFAAMPVMSAGGGYAAPPGFVISEVDSDASFQADSVFEIKVSHEIEVGNIFKANAEKGASPTTCGLSVVVDGRVSASPCAIVATTRAERSFAHSGFCRAYV